MSLKPFFYYLQEPHSGSVSEFQNNRLEDKSNFLSITLWWTNALLFTLVYSILPFFTGTQNTYFLHGLTQMGYGHLQQDWLANTTDSKPIFTLIIRIIYELADVYGLYVLYVFLLGIYFNSMVSIVNAATNHFFAKKWSYGISLIAVLLLLHSPLTYILIQKVTGVYFEQVLLKGTAGQSILDHYLQTQTFGVFLILSVALFLQEKWGRAIFFACFAALNHISYLMPAAIIILVCMISIYLRERSIIQSIKAGILGLVIVLPIVLYTLYAFMPLSDKAKDILYFYRIPHHANPLYWYSAYTLIKIVLMLIAIYMLRTNKRFFSLYISLFLFSLVLTLMQIFTGNQPLALTFPWRISVVLVPMATCLIGGWACRSIWSFLHHKKINAKFTVSGVYMGIGLLVAGGIYLSSKHYEGKKKAHVALQDIAKNINLPEKAGFCILIPTSSEDFRLTTGLPVFIDYKSHPYRSDELEEWYTRVKLAEKFYHHQMTPMEISRFFSRYHIQFVVTYHEDSLKATYLLAKEYANENYTLYHAQVYSIESLRSGTK